MPCPSKPTAPSTDGAFVQSASTPQGFPGGMDARVEPARARVDAEWVFNRYQSIRTRLPKAGVQPICRRIDTLGDLVDSYDTFLFDSYGVLNIGTVTVPGAVDRIGQLRAMGKTVLVLTNAASIPPAAAMDKYRELGFDFTAEEIVSSRAVLAAALSRFSSSMLWSVIDKGAADHGDLGVRTRPFDEDMGKEADGIILLSSAGWSDRDQQALFKLLGERNLPLLVGNPDVAAPREGGFSREPGAIAHDLADTLGISPVFFGKPYGNAFEMAFDRVGDRLDPRRTLMIGDTLHTDILGGQTAGLATALVTDHGVLSGMNVDACIRTAGIVPDYILPTI